MKKLKLGYLVLFIQQLILPVLAHSGHPEDQVIDGIDNGILTFLVIFVLLIVVVIVAYFQGKKAAAQAKAQQSEATQQ